MSSKFLTVAATAVASALLLTGCDLPLKGGDGAPTKSSEESLSMAPAYDTGSYKPEPHPGWPEETWESLGPITETTLIGGNTLLPYEVDPRFTLGLTAQRQTTFELFTNTMPTGVPDRITSLEPTYLTGYTQRASDTLTNSRAENTLLRFVSPEAAKEAAKVLHEALLAAGGTDFINDSSYPLENVTFPSNETILASKDERRQILRAFVPKDEYVLYVYTSNLEVDANGNETQPGPEAMDWMSEYVNTTVDKQLPLIDLIPSHKTPEGYGKSDKWQDVDPDDILRYTVLKPEDKNLVGVVPMSMNSRLFAAQFSNVPEILKMFDSAKIEAAAASETTLVRASNAANADLIEASFKAIDSNSEDSATLQLYDEPQNVPGTTCYASPRDGQTYYFCYLRYKNYFAHAGITESHPLDDEVKTTPDSGAEELDPKKTLSQIIAAQYYILEKAPTK